MPCGALDRRGEPELAPALAQQAANNSAGVDSRAIEHARPAQDLAAQLPDLPNFLRRRIEQADPDLCFRGNGEKRRTARIYDHGPFEAGAARALPQPDGEARQTAKPLLGSGRTSGHAVGMLDHVGTGEAPAAIAAGCALAPGAALWDAPPALLVEDPLVLPWALELSLELPARPPTAAPAEPTAPPTPPAAPPTAPPTAPPAPPTPPPNPPPTAPPTAPPALPTAPPTAPPALPTAPPTPPAAPPTAPPSPPPATAGARLDNNTARAHATRRAAIVPRHRFEKPVRSCDRLFAGQEGTG